MSEYHFFPGSNTPRGFFSRFDQILSPEKRKRVLVLKGGPGVGKSTFMRRIGEHFAAQCPTSEYFHCSSDPHSLDAVCFPESGVYLVDGTAPHIVDPSLPGAADGIVNLGDFLNERALEDERPHIEAIQRDIHAQFDRAYCCLRACAALREDTAAAYARFTDGEKLRKLSRKLAESYLPSPAPDTAPCPPRELFLTAYTPEGLLSLLGDNPPARVVRLHAPWGADVSGPLRALLDHAAQNGIPSFSFLDPLFPDRPAHVFFPDQSLLFTTLDADHPEETIDLTDLYEPVALHREEELIIRRRVTFEMIEHGACDALREAHRLHDALEVPYVAHMDFSRWQERFDSAVQKLSRYFN